MGEKVADPELPHEINLSKLQMPHDRQTGFSFGDEMFWNYVHRNDDGWTI